MNTHSPRVRPAAVAGTFYPAHAGTLVPMVEAFVASSRTGMLASPKAVIAPHAGYPYSGPIAGSALGQWAQDRGRIQRIVLLGPSHYIDFEGIALPDATALATPLGEIPLDREATRDLQGLPSVRVFDPAHRQEHCLEVELPFLQVLLRDFTVIPLVVGRASDDEVSELINVLWGGDETRVVISSDLSHYLDYPAACREDQITAEHIQSLNPAPITPQRACGYRSVRGLLRSATQRGLRAETVDLRNSGDTAGPRDRVVGYGAFHFVPAHA